MVKKYFILYPVCILVKGKSNACICDLQRGEVYRIPLDLYNLFDEDRIIDLTSIFRPVKESLDNIECIKEYISFLEENDLGLLSDIKIPFKKLRTNFHNPRKISNCIIDFDVNTDHPLSYISEELNKLKCEALEMRYFDKISHSRVCEDVTKFNDSTLRSISVLLVGSNSEAENNEFIKKTIYINPRITSITFHSSNTEKYETFFNFLSIHHTKAKVNDETCCGSFSDLYLTSQTQFYLETLHFNNCLNQKISIDRLGKIKNCPSMTKDFGDVSLRPSFEDIVTSEDFRYLWKIKKDDIEICKDCELRYACLDCRAYLTDPQNLLSKPVKCKYTP